MFVCHILVAREHTHTSQHVPSRPDIWCPHRSPCADRRGHLTQWSAAGQAGARSNTVLVNAATHDARRVLGHI
eukprot:519014-Prymnesium_polylepis.1